MEEDIKKLKKLAREDIEWKYDGKPVYIISKEKNKHDNREGWYIVVSSISQMPLYMLTEKESKMYDKDESSIEGIHLCGADMDSGHCMWIDMDKKIGWSAYGYY